MTTSLLDSAVQEETASPAVPPKEQSNPTSEVPIGIFPDNLSWKHMSWGVLIWMTAMHVGSLAAPFFFTWEALGVTVLLHWLTASIGICLGYHRYLSHRTFKMKPPAEFFTMVCSVLSGEGTPLSWTAVHRMHHHLSDKPGDPHSPLDGKWWSHLLWMFVKFDRKWKEDLYARYVPDLVNRPVLQFLERTYAWWLIGSGVALYALGGLPMLLWGLCVRMVFAYHSTWFVNSATHLWGYKNYASGDESRNLWWVALLSYGEGWHNNHHAYPNLAPAGHRWWEIDMTWWVIKALRACGQAYDVKDQLPAPDQRVQKSQLAA